MEQPQRTHVSRCATNGNNEGLGEIDTMDIYPHLAELGIRLTETAIRNAAGVVYNKIQAAKAKQDDKETIHELEEIISNLIFDKDDLIRIAQAYKQELVAQQISQENIEYITTKFIPVLKNFIKQASSDEKGGEGANIEQAIDALTPLLSVEMLTVLQLIGFNFKQAIGEPLTILLQKFITSKAPADPQSELDRSKLALKYNTEALKVVQDEDASERLEQLRSKGIL